MKNTFYLIFSLIATLMLSCNGGQQKIEHSNPEQTFVYNSVGSIESNHPDFYQLVSKDASIKLLASGFTWSEGPLWLPDQSALIFTDVPENTIYRWSVNDSITVYLKPSGFTGDTSLIREGANGLILDRNGRLVLCQHGNRQLARMNASLSDPKPDFEVITDHYNDDRYNSPNDACMSKSGIFYFTDPPYGLSEDEEKEIDFQGVYRVDSIGSVTLLIDSLSRPNGIALSPDERTLYVAVSDPNAAKYYAYFLDETGFIQSGKVLLDVTPLVKSGKKGLPDGLKIDNRGNLFATGPGGVLVITPEGQHLGTINTGQSTANCAFNKDKSVLYMTAHMHLMAIQLKN